MFETAGGLGYSSDLALQRLAFWARSAAPVVKTSPWASLAQGEGILWRSMKQPQHAMTTGLTTVGWVRCPVESASWSRWMGQGSALVASASCFSCCSGAAGALARRLRGSARRLEQVFGGSAVKLSPAPDGIADQVVKAVREHRLERIVASCVTILARIWQEERPLG